MNWLRLHVSNLCNFKCPNCHVFELGENLLPSQIMSQLTFDESLEQFIKVIEAKKQKEFTVSIYGGESLANKKVIKLGIENFTKLQKDLKVNWIVNTNGSLIEEEDAKFFSKYQVELHVSIDGNEEIHNLSRPTHVGKGTFHKVIQGIEKLSKLNVKMQLNSYMMPTNIHYLNEIVDIAKKYSIKKIYLDQFYNEEMIKYDEGFELYRKVLHYAQKSDIEIFGPWKKVLNRKLSLKKREEDLAKFNLIDVNVDGTFYLSNFVETKKYIWKISSLFDLYQSNTIWDEIEKLKVTRSKDCNECELKEVCFGEAKEQVYYHINRNADTSISCKFYKSIVNYLSRSVYTYSSYQIQFISFYPEKKSSELINEVKLASELCANFLNKDKISFICKLVESKEELEVACKQVFPEWVKASTYGNQLIHIGLEPSKAIRHEVAHIYMKDFKLKIPNWLEEGFCEWVDTQELLNIKTTKDIFLKQLLKENKLNESIDILKLDDRKPKENQIYLISHALISSIIADKGKEYFLEFLNQEGDFEKVFQSMYGKSFNQKVTDFIGEVDV